MASLIQTGKYGAINAPDPAKVGDYLVKYLSESYTLQEDKNTNENVCTAGDLVVK